MGFSGEHRKSVLEEMKEIGVKVFVHACAIIRLLGSGPQMDIAVDVSNLVNHPPLCCVAVYSAP